MYEMVFTRNAERYYNRLDDNTAAFLFLTVKVSPNLTPFTPVPSSPHTPRVEPPLASASDKKTKTAQTERPKR